MKVTATEKGFRVLSHLPYSEESDEEIRLVQESSAVGNYDDSMDRPGSSFLWIGKDHHLNREEVAELIEHMRQWLDTGQLPM